MTGLIILALVLADSITLYVLFLLIVWVPLPLLLVVVLSLIEHTTGRLRVIPIFFKVVSPLFPVPAQVLPLYWGISLAGGVSRISANGP